MALAGRIGHSQDIETSAPPFTVRYASTIAAVLLVLSATAAAALLWVYREDGAVARLVNEPLTTVFELLCYGLVGALLISRRPDLPFGWILGLGALSEIVLVGVGLPSLALADAGNQRQFLAWGICLGVLQWVPTALQGVVNVRFPSGRPSSTLGHWLDRALCYGIALALVGSYLGDSALANLSEPVSNHRFIDGTWVTPIGNASIVLIPLMILLGILAGVGVIVRCFRARGIEREQLQWRAAGAAASLLLFPLALLGVVDGLDAVVPIIFASTLAIPVLRYQLWSGDPIPRRRRVGPLVSRRTLIEAREEERRRLRRDLHDGLGPMLTGLRLNLDATQAQFTSDPEKAQEHLATARRASAEAISDLRGLVYGLRPPALDELGLAGSLRLHLAALVTDSPLEVTLDADEQLVAPAAVEVAVFRSACEAVTNVVRHGTAQQCEITVATDGTSVILTVDDDGPIHHTWHPGVGLTSMRERAVELGGTFVASSGPSGFHIKVSYPRT